MLPDTRRARRLNRRYPKREQVGRAFDRDALKRICEMHEDDFEETFNMEKVWVKQFPPDDFYYFRDNGADILAVAHLDTCVDHSQRMCSFAETAAGTVVHSGALDDRLGAYIILDLLPKLGVNVDLLLTVGEEMGQSTASFFEPKKEYNWMVEFDRGGTDVVLYQYEDYETRGLVKDCGAEVGIGAFSDISYLSHVEVKGFNWGVGYEDYHSVRGYAYLQDTIKMVAYFLDFHEVNKDKYLPHDSSSERDWFSRGRGGSSWGSLWGDEQADSFADWDVCQFCYEPIYMSQLRGVWVNSSLNALCMDRADGQPDHEPEDTIHTVKAKIVEPEVLAEVLAEEEEPNF